MILLFTVQATEQNKARLPDQRDSSSLINVVKLFSPIRPSCKKPVHSTLVPPIPQTKIYLHVLQDYALPTPKTLF